MIDPGRRIMRAGRRVAFIAGTVVRAQRDMTRQLNIREDDK
jgi:hypothetical protein